MSKEKDNFIEGWKIIADYLGVSVRTAQRWAREKELPVYQKGKGSKVYTFKNELDEWLKAEENKVLTIGNRNPKGFIAYIFLSFILIMVFAIGINPLLKKKNKKEYNRLFCKVTEFNNRKRFSVFNQKNEEVLTLAYESTNKLAENKKIQYFDIGDLNGDGLEDFVFFPLESENNNTLFVYLQNKRGKLDLFLKKTIIERAMFEGRNIELNHIHLVRIVDLNKDGKGEIVICLNNLFFYPSAILFFDYKLEKKLLEITHPGWFFDITARDLNNDGINEVYICATNNYLQHKKSEQVAIAVDLKGLDCKKISINNPLKKGLNPELKCHTGVVYVRFGFNENIVNYIIWQYPLLKSNKNKEEKMLVVMCDNFQTDKLFQNSKWWEVKLRGFFFTYMLKKAGQPFWNDAYLEKLKIKIPEKDYKDLLNCRYFNGKGWQKDFCYYPAK